MRLCCAHLLFLAGATVVCSSEDGIPCPVRTSNCHCSFSNDDGLADNTENEANAETKANVMAITAGALGPLVIGGMGLGIWKLVTRAKDDSKSDDLWPLQGRETPGYGSRRGSNGSLSMLGTDDEISFTNSSAGSTADLTRTDDDEFRNRPHPSHNWGSDNPYPGTQIPRNTKSVMDNLEF